MLRHDGAQSLGLPILLLYLHHKLIPWLRRSTAVWTGERDELVHDGAEHSVSSDVEDGASKGFGGRSGELKAFRRGGGAGGRKDGRVVGVDEGGGHPGGLGGRVVGGGVGGEEPLAADGVGEGERG